MNLKFRLLNLLIGSNYIKAQQVASDRYVKGAKQKISGDAEVNKGILKK